MEGLLVILVGLLGDALLIIAVLSSGLLASLVGVILSALSSLAVAVISALFRPRVAEGAPRQTSPQPEILVAVPVPPPVAPRRGKSWTRWLVIGSLGLLVLITAAALVINTWFLGDLLRWALARQEKHSGIHVDFGNFDGSLVSGRYELSGVRLNRHNHPAGDLDLSAHRVQVSLPFWSAWERMVPIRSLRIEELRGHYNRGVLAGKNGSQPEDVSGHRSPPDPERKPGRRFAIETLEIADLAVEFTDYTWRKPVALPITIAHMRSSPFRSNWAVFDILFRSNADGSLMGRPFKIATGGDDSGRVTEWSVSDLPVEVLSGLIGGPFKLVTQGRCDVQVTDRWRLGRGGIIEMDWKIVVRDVHGEIPLNLTGIRRTLAIAAVKMLNASSGEIPLGFTLHIDHDRFEGTSTLEAAGLWHAVDEALTRKLAEKSGLPPETIEQFQKDAADVAKGLLDRWRKRKK